MRLRRQTGIGLVSRGIGLSCAWRLETVTHRLPSSVNGPFDGCGHRPLLILNERLSFDGFLLELLDEVV